MSKIWFFLLLSSFLLPSAGVKASIQYNANCRLAYQNALQFHFAEMDQLLKAESATNPSNQAVASIRAYGFFLKYVISEDPAQLKAFNAAYDRAVEAIEEESEKNPYRGYLLTDLFIQSAIVNALNESYLSAFLDFKKAYSTIYKNKSQFPDFELNNKAIGILNIGIGSIPKSYSWALQVMDLQGNLKLGEQQLAEVLRLTQHKEEYHYLFVEALLMHSFTQSNYVMKVKGSAQLESIFSDKALLQKLKNNQLFIFAKVSYHQHAKENDQAIAALAIVQNEFQNNPYKLHFLDYLYGESLLFKQDQGSKFYFNRYINAFPGKNYVAAARQHLAWQALLLGNMTEYSQQMKLVSTSKNLLFDSDKQAFKEANTSEIPNTGLLKSRLLFDGGYYSLSEGVLRKSFTDGKLQTEKEKLEYIYRLARIYDEWGNFTLAEIYYTTTIEKGKDLPYFFAANSALQLAYEYESQGKKAKAKSMYQLCLDLEFDEYQNSITQKAKAGLNRLENKQS